MAEPPDRNEREHRRRVLKGGTIILGINKSEISCSIRNQHEHGALLVVPPGSVVPETFTLFIRTDNTAYQAVVRWRRGNELGVQFTGTGPKPRLHYG